MIRNVTRETTLATDVHWARSAGERTRGLLDWLEIVEGQALIISPCNSIHMIGMAFAIDVLFVDKTGRVLRAIEAIRPWRFTRIYFRARHTIELPIGAIARSQTEVGDQLEFGLS
jgi:uncharacterized membrane protein (UPF0127 family)